MGDQLNAMRDQSRLCRYTHNTWASFWRCATISIVCFALGASTTSTAETIAIFGGTLIDLSDFGHSARDLTNAVVVIENGRFASIGSSQTVKVPTDATIIDAKGRFLIPGLIDGFGAVRNQEFARAYLDEGVTTVYVPTIVAGGGGDGELTILKDGSPSPHVFLGAPMTGYSAAGFDPSDKPMTEHRLHDTRLTDEQLKTRIDELASRGYRGVTVSFDVWPDQLDVIVREAHHQGLAVFAEPGFTSYPYAIRSGVDALLRNDHYQMALTPELAQLKRADNPTAGIDAYSALCATDPAERQVTALGTQLAESHTALMPMLALEATADSLNVPNPWRRKSAELIDPKDIDVPIDKQTGRSGFLMSLPASRRSSYRKCGLLKENIDSHLFHAGARFLAGSSASSYGVMPGGGLHLELILLQRIGLTPREALAAATTNFADICRWKDVGTIATGRIADMLILDRNPTIDLAALDHISDVIVNGVRIRKD